MAAARTTDKHRHEDPKGWKGILDNGIITSLSEGHSCEQYDFIDLRKLLSVEINRRLLLNAECSCWFFLLPHFAAILLIRDHTFPHDVQRKCPKYASLVRASSTYAVEWHKLWHIKSTFCLSAGGKLIANRLLHIWAHLGGAIEESWLVELGDFNIFPAWNKGSSGWWTRKMDPFNNDPISHVFGSPVVARIPTRISETLVFSEVDEIQCLSGTFKPGLDNDRRQTLGPQNNPSGIW